MSDHQAEHGDSGTADGVYFRIDGDSANGGPGKHDGDNSGVENMRPPTQAVMAKHGSQDQLDVEHKNRKQSQREKSGTALIRLGARLLFHPLAPGEYGDRDGYAEKGLSHGSVRAGDGSGQKN